MMNSLKYKKNAKSDRIFCHTGSKGWNSAEFRTKKSPGRKIPRNSVPKSLHDEKFHGIPGQKVSGTKNSTEFRVKKSPGRKIPRNSGSKSLQNEKFHGIPGQKVSGTKNSMEFRVKKSPGRKIPWNSRSKKRGG
jgi:hypothetical protein